MKTGFKSLVRAISPFVGPKDKPGQETEKSFNEYHWDLTKVDMEAMLTNFYKIYNSDRVRKVNHILGEFGGEEILMLQQLCERYNLSEADMQRFLDDAPLGKKDRFGNWMRRKEGSTTFSDSGNNASLEGKEKVVDYGTYKWDLEAVDLAKALKLVYRKHNPEKKPNVASLQNKSTADKILLLQQLCKRHNLTQGDMRVFLDKARVRGEGSNTSAISNRSNAADDSSVSSKSRASKAASAAMEAAAGLFSVSLSKPPVPSSTPAAASSSSSASTAAQQDDAQNIITGGMQRQGSLPFWQSSFPSPFGSPPPPPPPPSPPRPPQPAPSAIAGFLAESLASRGSPGGSEVGSVSSSVTAPSLASGGARTGSKLGAAMAAQAASAGSVGSGARPHRAPSPSPSVLTTSSIGSASMGRGARPVSASNASARTAAAAATSFTEDADHISVARSVGRAQHKSAQSVTAGSSAGDTTASTTRAGELLQAQEELSAARAQLSGLQRENRALLKALQESRQRHSDAESTISGLSSQPHPEQVPELLLEVAKLNGVLKQQEERELALKRQYTQVKQQVAELQDQRAREEQRCVEARADFRDVLRLVDIMSASPAGIRAVLEAYLKKLGDATNNMTVKLGIGSDGRQIPISERIALALQVKREQEKSSSRVGSRSSSSEASAVDDEHSAEHKYDSSTRASTRSQSAGGESSSSSAAKEARGGLQNSSSQRDHFELFRSKIAQARQRGTEKEKRAVKRSQRPNHEQDSRAPELQQEDAESAEGDEESDFADYASPEPSRGQAASAKGSSKPEGEAIEPVQAIMAGEIAGDWVECLDPRSRRKYYYSASLKKSTWVRPTSFGPSSQAPSPAAIRTQAAGAALSSMTSGVPSRYASPLAPARPHQGWNDREDQSSSQQKKQHDSTNDGARPVPSSSSLSRSTSRSSALAQHSAEALYSNVPESLFATGGSFTSQSSAADYSAIFTSPAKGLAPTATKVPTNPTIGSSRTSSPAASLHSRSTLSRSSSPATALEDSSRADWVVTVDPRSQKKYWYNRRTKVSTWRQPAELIV